MKTTTTAEIIASNAAVSVDQRRDYPNAAAATAAYWTNVIDTCDEYRLPIPRGSRTRYLQEVAAEARRVADARRTAAMRRRAGHRAAVVKVRKDLNAAVAAEEAKFQAFKASRNTSPMAATAAPTLAALRADCLALMATAAASGTVADAMAAHQAAARHDALYWASRAVAVADVLIAAGSAPRD